MEDSIRENTAPVALDDPTNEFWTRTKVSDDYLPVVFRSFFSKVGLPVSMNKSDYAELADLLLASEVHREIVEVLDQIARVASPAKPLG
jgi:hypothetical protein